jgi:hypothetical protein
MLRKVKIISPPKKAQGGKVRVNPAMGFNANALNWPAMPGQMSNKPVSVNQTVKPVNRKDANVEAENGETVVTDFAKTGIPQHYKIGGQRHSKGGTPLSLSPDSFIFSDTKAMKISDEDVLAMFNKNKKKGGGMTPADIAKQYNINEYYKTLMDPNSDDLQRKTAEMMIANYNLKLGKLGLVQESMKGFPQGLPAISQPYLESVGLDPTKFVETQGQREQPQGDMAKYGKEIKRNLPKARGGLEANPRLGQTIGEWENENGIKSERRNMDEYGYIWNGTDFVPPENLNTGASQGAGFPGKIFGNRRQPVGYRVNNNTGMIEVVNDRGEVVGYGNPGQLSGNINMGGGFGGNSSTTVTTTSTKKVKKQNIPSDAIIIKKSDPDYIKKRDEAFATNPGKVYIQGDDGKYSKVKEVGYSPDDQLGLIEERFKDPAVAKALKEQAIANLKDPNKSGKISGKNTRFTISELEKMSDEEFAKQFVDMQKRNIGLIKKNIDVKNYDQAGKLLPGKKGPATLTEAFKEINMPVSDKDAALQQASYIAYNDLVNAKDKGEIKDEKLATALKPFKVQQVGVKDETYGFDPENDISKIDGYYTNTSAGQVAGITGKKLGEEGVAETEVDDTSTQTNTQNQQADLGLYGNTRIPKKEIFLQDAVKTLGAWGDLMRVKKYMPWQATPDLEQRQGAYYSPERELAANAEQSNIAQNVLAMFAGPKLYSSRASQIQGQGAKNAADILGRYNNLNVGIANQIEQENFAARNRHNELKAKLATDLYDKTTIANQQFDNAKNLGRQNLRQSFIDTITNASMAYNLNQLYPQFNISPSTGGDIFFTGGKRVKPSANTQSDVADKFNTMKTKLPGVSDEVIWKMVNSDSGGKTNQDFDPEGLAALQGLMSNLG